MGYTTKKSLLEAIRKGDDVSWNEFYETYRPLIVIRGSELGLSAHEQQDLEQLVMLDIFKTSKTFKYDPSKGRFRAFMRSVITSNAVDILRKRRNFAEDVDLTQIPDEAEDSKWEDEWHSHIMNQALLILQNEVEITTFQAFELYALKNQEPGKIASFLKISQNSVYIAKTRCIGRLREIARKLSDE